MPRSFSSAFCRLRREKSPGATVSFSRSHQFQSSLGRPPGRWLSTSPRLDESRCPDRAAIRFGNTEKRAATGGCISVAGSRANRPGDHSSPPSAVSKSLRRIAFTTGCGWKLFQRTKPVIRPGFGTTEKLSQLNGRCSWSINRKQCQLARLFVCSASLRCHPLPGQGRINRC